MTARTVVVKRPRRRLFAFLWQLPHGLRVMAGAGARRPRPPHPAAVGVPMRPLLLWTTAEGGHRCVGCGRCIHACPGRALALELAEDSGPAGRPTQEAQAAEPVRRTPRQSARRKKKAASRTLGSVPSPPARVRRFELAPGRCIGCGLCVDLCPESALVRGAGTTFVGPGSEPHRWSLIDLLQTARS